MSFVGATPQPRPGAFFVTPAPPRTQAVAGADPVTRRLFADLDGGPGAVGPSNAGVIGTGGVRDVGTVGRQSRPGTPSPEERDLEPVELAARAINSFLARDDNFPEIDAYCRQGASSDYDLPIIDSTWTPFHKTQTYPIPNEIFENINTGHVQTLMGLFADINHAWASIDNALFIWDYTDPEPTLIGFEEQRHTIQAVALVPPKPGIFIDTITHVLIIATTNEMMVLGVQTDKNAAGNTTVSLYQTNMHMALRGQDVRIITGSSGGRVFFGGSGEIDLNELYYEKEERWFWGKCGKINHTNPKWLALIPPVPSLTSFSGVPEFLIDIVLDDTRNLIYTLSNKSTIRTYHMDGPASVTKVIEKEKTSCLRDITHMISGSPLLTERMVVTAISPISATESPRLHLMALTNTGCRLFLSATSSASFMVTTSSTLAPQSMQVQFIKFPPPTRPGGSYIVGNENMVDLTSKALDQSRHGKRLPPGYFLDFVCKEALPNEDLLFVSAPESGRIKNTPNNTALRYYEHGNWVEIGSRAEAVGLITKPFAAANQPAGFGNELAVQYDEPPSEFAVLTNTGVHVIRRRRLVDIFAATMRATVGDEGIETEARKFTQSYGRVETVSTALAVACGHGSDGRMGAARAIDQATQDRAKVVFIDFGGSPSYAETDGSGSLVDNSVKLSSRHDALGLYLGRLIRMLWRSAVVSVRINSNGAGIAIAPTVLPEKLVSVQENLERLRRFLDANRAFVQGLSRPADMAFGNRHEEYALQAEHQALHALEKLMESISEGISFVQMLFDERVVDIYNRLEEKIKKQFRELTYERLFSQKRGKELAKLLVRAIVNRNIESGSNVETVADALRRRCGSFCSPDDVVVFKAQEQLKRATDQSLNANLKRTLLLESLRLFERVAGNLTDDNLQAAVLQYIDLRYFAGAIQLCLTAARERDRGNTALAWVREGPPDNDPREDVFHRRRICYDLVYAVLEGLDDALRLEPEVMDGRLTLIGTKRVEAYEVVNSSDDEVFHRDLYEWYLQKGWADRLLNVESPHVITFLQERAKGSVDNADLLCRYYTLHDRFHDAGTVQFELANSDFGIGIKERITLLSQARGNASVPTAGVSRQQQQMLAHQTDQLLEVAHIQDDLLERLKLDRRIDPGRFDDIAQSLDGKIIGLSELFNQYADQAGYYDLCLLIYHSADYRTSGTIANTWRNLIQQAHEQADDQGEEDSSVQYESVAARVQAIAHRTSLDSFVFPIATLIPELCSYSVQYQQDGRVGADPNWPVRLFLSLGVSPDMVTRVLENLFDTQDHGFTGALRLRVIEWITTVIEIWIAEVRRRGGNGGNRMNGSASIGPGSTLGGAGGAASAGGVLAQWVADLLIRCDDTLPSPTSGASHQNVGGCDLPELRRRVRGVKRDVQSMTERLGSTMRWA